MYALGGKKNARNKEYCQRSMLPNFMMRYTVNLEGSNSTAEVVN